MVHIGFLGGIAEFGNNCTFIEYNNEIIIIDIGFKFFTQNEMGIRYEIPDFSYLINNKKKIKGIIITHGHLDHIGGIPYFFKHIQCDIYCSSFTQHLIKKQLKNKNHLKNIKIINDKNFKIGNFKIEPFPVTHSIIDSLGFIIHTPLKDKTKLIFCGDLNYDNKPFIGKTNNFSFITNNYKNNPKILFLDSTNATEQGYNYSESEIYNNLSDIFKEYSGKNRLIFTTFSSQIQRILEIIKLSNNHNRKVVAIGKSIFDNLEYIFQLNEYKNLKNKISFSEDSIKNNRNSNEKLTIIATGSQGEENSAISKILENKIRGIKINSNDLFIFSSSIIPGNEKRIFEIWNQIYFNEAEVISYRDRVVHSSGHGKIQELKKIINNIKPDYIIPIHGEYRNLYNQKKLALEEKIKKECIFIAHKGDILKISDKSKNNKISLDHNMNLKNIILDQEDNVIDNKVIEDRKKMVKNGLLIIGNLKKNNIEEILVKGIGIANFHSNEELALKELIYNEWGEKKEKIDNLIKIFFREKGVTRPVIVRL